MTPNQKKLTQYAAANIEAARIITSDPVRYPKGSLLHVWAQRTQLTAAGIDTGQPPALPAGKMGNPQVLSIDFDQYSAMAEIAEAGLLVCIRPSAGEASAGQRPKEDPRDAPTAASLPEHRVCFKNSYAELINVNGAFRGLAKPAVENGRPLNTPQNSRPAIGPAVLMVGNGPLTGTLPLRQYGGNPGGTEAA